MCECVCVYFLQAISNQANTNTAGTRVPGHKNVEHVSVQQGQQTYNHSTTSQSPSGTLELVTFKYIGRLVALVPSRIFLLLQLVNKNIH